MSRQQHGHQDTQIIVTQPKRCDAGRTAEHLSHMHSSSSSSLLHSAVAVTATPGCAGRNESGAETLAMCGSGSSSLSLSVSEESAPAQPCSRATSLSSPAQQHAAHNGAENGQNERADAAGRYSRKESADLELENAALRHKIAAFEKQLASKTLSLAASEQSSPSLDVMPAPAEALKERAPRVQVATDTRAPHVDNAGVRDEQAVKDANQDVEDVDSADIQDMPVRESPRRHVMRPSDVRRTPGQRHAAASLGQRQTGEVDSHKNVQPDSGLRGFGQDEDWIGEEEEEEEEEEEVVVEDELSEGDEWESFEIERQTRDYKMRANSRSARGARDEREDTEDGVRQVLSEGNRGRWLDREKIKEGRAQHQRARDDFKSFPRTDFLCPWDLLMSCPPRTSSLASVHSESARPTARSDPTRRTQAPMHAAEDEAKDWATYDLLMVPRPMTSRALSLDNGITHGGKTRRRDRAREQHECNVLHVSRGSRASSRSILQGGEADRGGEEAEQTDTGYSDSATGESVTEESQASGRARVDRPKFAGLLCGELAELEREVCCGEGRHARVGGRRRHQGPMLPDPLP